MCCESNDLGWAAVRHLPDAALQVGLDAIGQFHAGDVGGEVWVSLTVSSHSGDVDAEVTGFSVGGGFFTGTLVLTPSDHPRNKEMVFPRAVFVFNDGAGPDSRFLEELFVARLNGDDAAVARLIATFGDITSESPNPPGNDTDGIEW